MACTNIARLDLCLYQGDTYEHQVEFVDDNGDLLDMSGWLYEAVIQDRNARHSMTIDSSNALDGLIILSLTAEETAAIGRQASWDLQRTSTDTPPIIETLLYGNVSTGRDVT